MVRHAVATAVVGQKGWVVVKMDVVVCVVCFFWCVCVFGWWFQIFFTPIFGEMIQFDYFFCEMGGSTTN